MSIIEKCLMVANYSLVDYFHFDKIMEIIDELHNSELTFLFAVLSRENLSKRSQTKVRQV